MSSVWTRQKKNSRLVKSLEAYWLNIESPPEILEILTGLMTLAGYLSR